MKRIVIIVSGLLAIAVIIGIVMASRKESPTSQVGVARRQGSSDDILPAIREIFQKGSGAIACRNAIQQLNTYLERNPDKKSEPLSDPRAVRKQFGLGDDELAEINSTSFTLLDAHYIDFCQLLRDAAYSLSVDQLPPLERAQAAFEWIMRQVQLPRMLRPLPVAPTQFVLRRGWGSALERSLAFLAMLHQLGIPGCIVALPDEAGGGRLISWIPGALTDGEIYLFDTRMGIPLPSPDGKGVATLRQIRSHANPFEHLRLDEKHSYDVKKEQVQRAEILLTVPLSGLAPRMKFLDATFAGRQKTRASVDWETLLKEFQAATQSQNLTIRFWGESGDPTAPMRLLRAFLPPLEGGTDQAGLLRLMTLQLVPGFTLPSVILEQRNSGEFGQQLEYLFWLPFIEFFVDPRGQSPRELVLRGQLDEASTRLTQAPVLLHFRESLLGMFAPLSDAENDWVRRGMRKLKLEALEDISQTGFESSEQNVRAWCNRAFSAYVQYLRAGSEEERQAARQQAVKIFMEGDDDLNRLFLGAVGKPLAAQAAFQKALCFHERAARTATSVNWKTAAAWWMKYVEDKDYSAGPRISQARLLRAQALLKQPDIAAAKAELTKPDPGLTDLEELGRLYQIRQLK
jgi:hypothetical protein